MADDVRVQFHQKNHGVTGKVSYVTGVTEEAASALTIGGNCNQREAHYGGQLHQKESAFNWKVRSLKRLPL